MSFAELCENDRYYVDKTMLIADILSEGAGDVYMFTRPRWFGKTLNISMLDAEVNDAIKQIHRKGTTRACLGRPSLSDWCSG